TTLFAGTGSQTGTSNRWGDYSALTVDPVDDCTFWYTTEYYATTSQFNWRTRIGNFKFPGCGGSTATGTLTGIVTDSTTSAAISGALVQLSNGSSTTTDPSGVYSTSVAQGTYSVTFSKSGYVTQTIPNVAITSGATTTQDAKLVPASSSGPTAQITTSNACSAFSGGTATSLNSISYGVKPNGTINVVSPNAFYYWVKVNVTTTTLVINQALTPSSSFKTLFQQAASSVYDSACNSTGLNPTFT